MGLSRGRSRLFTSKHRAKQTSEGRGTSKRNAGKSLELQQLQNSGVPSIICAQHNCLGGLCQLSDKTRRQRGLVYNLKN